MRDCVPCSPCVCVSVVCGAQVALRKPDLELGGWSLRWTRQPRVPVSTPFSLLIMLNSGGDLAAFCEPRISHSLLLKVLTRVLRE